MVPWRSGYRGGLLSRFPLGAQVRILPASKLFTYTLSCLHVYEAPGRETLLLHYELQ
jgi:hypothetical protein